MREIVLFVLLCVFAGSMCEKRQNIQRLSVTEGESIELTCNAKPNLIRSYRWVYVRERKRNDERRPLVVSYGSRLIIGEPRFTITTEQLNGSVAIKLKFKDIRLDESGYFMCWRQGLQPDPQIFVRVLTQGTADTEPMSMDINAPPQVKYGSQVTVACRIWPYWAGKVIWLKNNHAILSTDRIFSERVEESEKELLAFLDISTAREDANYTCRIPSDPPLQETLFIRVKIAKIEELSTDPHKENIQYGMTLSLTCVASGSDSEVVWLKDGVQLSITERNRRLDKQDEELSDGKWRSLLRVNQFHQGDNGHYVCYVPGDSKNVLVNIEGRPPQLLGVSGYDFLKREALRLTCSTQYVKGSKEVTWLFDNAPLNVDWWIEENSREAKHNITYHDLTIPSPTELHAGIYTCSTPFGSASVTIRQLVPPYLVEDPPPPNAVIKNGDSYELTCSIAGYPVPVVVWEKFIDNNWKIVEEAKTEREREVQFIEVDTVELMSGMKPIGEQQNLIFQDVTLFHAGKYQCVGYTEKDSITISTEISVLDPTPEIVEMIATEATEGDDLSITCAVTNWEEPVAFIRGLKVLSPDTDSRYRIEFQGVEYPDHEDATRNEIATYALIISDATLEDQGFYECHAGSEVSHSLEVKIILAPPEIVEIAASPAVERSEFFVSCTIKNIPLNEEVLFFNGDRNLNEENNERYSVHLAELMEEESVLINGGLRAKQATYVLKIHKAKVEEDSGQYECFVRPGINASIEVEVGAPETVAEEMTLNAFPTWIRGSLRLDCTVKHWEGDVSFFLNTSLPLDEDDDRFQLRKSSIENGTVHTLVISNLTEEDSGYYQCFSSPFAYAGVNVTLKSLDVININLTQFPAPSPVEMGSFLGLNCKANGLSNRPYVLEIIHNEEVFGLSTPHEGELKFHPRASLDIIKHEKMQSFDEEEQEKKEQNREDEGKWGEEDKEEEDKVEDVSDVLNSEELEVRLIINRVLMEDSGDWSCRITIPETDLYREAAVGVEVFEPIEFLSVPEAEIKALKGSAVSLKCSASGYPPPVVSWFKGETGELIMSGGAVSTIEISSVSESDFGDYTCIAENELESINSTTTIMLHGLEIIVQPLPVIFINEFDSTQLKCMAVGSETPTVTWRREGVIELLVNESDASYYKVENFTAEDAGVYICTASIPGAEETISTELILTRKADTSTTSFTPSPTLLSGRLVDLSGPSLIEEGDHLDLICLVSPLLDAYKAMIVVNNSIISLEDRKLTDDPRVNLQAGKGGAGERLLKLHLQPVVVADSGLYECRANTDIITRHSHFVRVVPEGEFRSTTTIGTTLSPTTTTKTTDPAVSSSISTEKTPSSTMKAISSSKTKVPTTTISTEEELRDIYDYNTYDDFTATIIEEEDYVKTAKVGDSVLLTCTANASDHVSIIWKQVSTNTFLTVDYMKLTRDERFTLEINEIANIYSRNIKIANLTEEDSDDYLCYVQTNPPTNSTVHLRVITTDQELPNVKGETSEEEKNDKDVEEEAEEKEEEVEEEAPESEMGEEEAEEERGVEEEEEAGVAEESSESDDKEEGEGEEGEGEEEEEKEKEEEGEGGGGGGGEEGESDSNSNSDSDSESDSEGARDEITGMEEESERAETVNTTEEKDGSEMEKQKQEDDTASLDYESELTEGSVTELQATTSTTVSSTDPNLDNIVDYLDYSDINVSTKISPSSSAKENEISVEVTTAAVTTRKTFTTEEKLDADEMTNTIKSTTSPTEGGDFPPYYFEYEEESDIFEEESYSTVASTPTIEAIPTEYPVIVAIPGDDAIAPVEAEVLLQCPTKAVPEDITWKGDDKLLFLGSLDLAGVEGIQLTIEGHLKLMPMYSDIKNDVAYSCLVYNYDTYEDVHVITYKVYLDAVAEIPDETTERYTTTIVPPIALEFSGLEFENVAVIANNKLAGSSLIQVLRQGGLDVLSVNNICRNSSDIEGWESAYEAVQECEMESRLLGSIEEDQSVFIIFDFFARLPPDTLYGSTILYVHNEPREIKAHVFGPLAPVPKGTPDVQIKCGSPVYGAQDLGLDLEGICRSAVSSTILTLQEAYLSQAKKMPLF